MVCENNPDYCLFFAFSAGDILKIHEKFNFIENQRKKVLRSSGIVEAGDSDSYNNKICLRLSAQFIKFLFGLSFCISQSLCLIERNKYFELLIMRKEDFVYNDFLLIRKMKQGDDNAFDLFVHKYYQEILSYCYHHCFDQTYAEDFTQETFIRFFSKLPDYHYKGKTLNYLYTIAGNLCKDYLKKTKEMLLEEIELVEENQTEQILNRVLIEQVLEQLPDESREVLTLYYFQELKLTEISDTLQIGLPLVKYRLQKARKQLRELLGKEEFDESKRKDKKI